MMFGVVFQTMVLNPTLTEAMLLEMVQKVDHYSSRVRISTPLVSSSAVESIHSLHSHSGILNVKYNQHSICLEASCHCDSDHDNG